MKWVPLLEETAGEFQLYLAASIWPLGLIAASRINTSLNRVEPEKSALRVASEQIFKTLNKNLIC